MKKVIIFNAPPRTGKDVACDHLMEIINTSEGFLPAHRLSLKDTLIDMTSRVFGLSKEKFLQGYEEPSSYGWMKDFPRDNLRINDKKYSQREALIHVSENVAKPMFGRSVFGDALSNQISQREGVIIVPDSGFNDEVQPIVEEVGAENILVVKIEREGCNFDNDSRDWLDERLFHDVEFITIQNDSSLDEYLCEVQAEVGHWLNK